MEACGSAHHWGRKLQSMGHTVRLMAQQFVKPYVKTNKNGTVDAEAICEVVGRPTMRFIRRPAKQAARAGGWSSAMGVGTGGDGAHESQIGYCCPDGSMVIHFSSVNSSMTARPSKRP